MPLTRRFDHAVVIGGSIAGLACARVLSDFFAKVTILEREAAPQGPTPRKCAPQGAHAHAVLEVAVRTLRAWFPGLLEEMVEGGAHLVDFCRDLAVYHYGGWKPRRTSGVETILVTRPFLEWSIRRHVARLPNVEILHQHTAEELLFNAAKTRVTGVRIKNEESERVVDADLVADTAGRGTRLPRWLEAHGFGRVEEQAVEVNLAYTSRLFELPKAERDYQWISVYERFPGHRGGFLYAVEGDRWLSSLVGYFGDHTPTTDEGFLEFARSLPVPDIYRGIASGKPISGIWQHKVPSSRWFHYEKLPRFPDGLVTFGDSACSLNPVYGQGMTVAIQCARVLEEELQSFAKRGDLLTGFSHPFQKKIASIIQVPWLLSTTIDLKFPKARGKRLPGLPAVQWLFQNLIDLTSLDPDACRIFYEVLNMRRGPEGLAHRDMLLPLLRYCAKSPFVPLEKRINQGPLPSIIAHA